MKCTHRRWTIYNGGHVSFTCTKREKESEDKTVVFCGSLALYEYYILLSIIIFIYSFIL